MTVRFYTGPRIISSVIHHCVRAAVKGLGFGFVIVAGTRMSRLRKPERVIFGLALLAGGCLLGPDFKPLQRRLPINGLSKATNPSTSARRSTGIGGQCSMTRG